MGATTVIFEGDKIKVREWSKKFKKYVTYTICEAEVIEHLWDVADVDGLRVRDALCILDQNTELWARILQEGFLPDLIKEFRRIVTGRYRVPKTVMSYAGCQMKPFTKVLVSLMGESALYDNSHLRLKFKKNGTLAFKRKMPRKIRAWTEYSQSMDVVGYCGRHRYGLDLCPLEAYLDAKIEVNPEFVMCRTDYTRNHIRKLRRDKYKDDCVNLGKTKMTVLELFKAIVFEFTFFGNAKMQAKKAKDIYGAVEAYKTRKET